MIQLVNNTRTALLLFPAPAAVRQRRYGQGSCFNLNVCSGARLYQLHKVFYFTEEFEFLRLFISKFVRRITIK